MIESDTLFVDSTHIKASANRNKKIKVEAKKKAQSYARELCEEIDRDREERGKKPFDDGEDSGETVTVIQSKMLQFSGFA